MINWNEAKWTFSELKFLDLKIKTKYTILISSYQKSFYGKWLILISSLLLYAHQISLLVLEVRLYDSQAYRWLLYDNENVVNITTAASSIFGASVLKVIMIGFLYKFKGLLYTNNMSILKRILNHKIPSKQ